MFSFRASVWRDPARFALRAEGSLFLCRIRLACNYVARARHASQFLRSMGVRGLLQRRPATRRSASVSCLALIGAPRPVEFRTSSAVTLASSLQFRLAPVAVIRLVFASDGRNLSLFIRLVRRRAQISPFFRPSENCSKLRSRTPWPAENCKILPIIQGLISRAKTAGIAPRIAPGNSNSGNFIHFPHFCGIAFFRSAASVIIGNSCPKARLKPSRFWAREPWATASPTFSRAAATA
jgi:hypothetical protein